MFNKCYITPLSFSDHNMVSCKFLLNSVKPKSAYWHFHTNLLNDKFFFESFKAFWEVFKKTKSSFKSLQQWWDYGKVQIKQFAQQYTQNVTKDLTRSLEVLEKQIDPPAKLMAEIQAVVVDFFWDKLHWIPQSILYLPKEGGGQGLIHLQSRIATFRLHFLQRFLDGPVNVSWRAIGCIILQTVGNFALDSSLFLMDSKCLNLSHLPLFYQNVFKVWSFFHIQNMENFHSIYWLLREPWICKAILDISTFLLGFSKVLQNSGVFVLDQLLSLTGPHFKDTEAVAKRLGLRSIRSINRFLTKLAEAFTSEEKLILEDFFSGINIPDSEDPFPCLTIQPVFEECSGILLKQGRSFSVDLFSCTGKELYKMCVLILNKKKLDKRIDTPWRSVFKLCDDVKPEWRVLYKPPLSKRAGDLQWRILHGAITVNSFISVLDSKNNSGCPFCFQKETVFQAFMYCFRLKPLFVLVQGMRDKFNVSFYPETFIFGFKYAQKKRIVSITEFYSWASEIGDLYE